jgi:hypothetical protein
MSTEDQFVIIELILEKNSDGKIIIVAKKDVESTIDVISLDNIIF